MAENYEKFVRRNEQIKDLLNEAEGLDERDENDRLFFCIRKASVLLEMQKSELRSLEHTRVSEEEYLEIRKIIAGYYSCKLQKDRIVDKVRKK
ncbi:MAG: hypothetical protein IKE01_02585 [Clostridia bacterium]|nr:hypothetical protein [Clostridia bacterium]